MSKRKISKATLAFTLVIAMLFLYVVPMSAFAQPNEFETGNAAGHAAVKGPQVGDVENVAVNMFDYNKKTINDQIGSGDNRFMFIGTKEKDPANPTAISQWTGKDGGVYQGLVKKNLGKNDRPIYSEGIQGIDLFNTKSNQYTVYPDVAFPFTYTNKGVYEFDSSKQKALYTANGNAVKVTAGGKDQQFFPFGEANFHFGMALETEFYIPTKTDGKDIVFHFSGDDDVWVFVDDRLVLDVGGIHDEYAGSINFTNGTVSNPKVYGVYDSKKATPPINSLDDVFGKGAGVKHFQDKKTHKLSVFYLERGAGKSNCKIQFNFALKQQLTVAKEITHLNDGITSTQKFNFKMETKKGEVDSYEVYRGSYDILNATTGETVDANKQTADGTFVLQDGQKARFDGIKMGTPFQVTETKPDPDAGTAKFDKMSWTNETGDIFGLTTTDDGAVEGILGAEEGQVCSIVCLNQRVSTDVTFDKVDADAAKEPPTAGNIGLYGAEFSLSGTANNSTETVQAVAVSSDGTDGGVRGSVCFKDIPAGTYLLTETKAPEGYERSTKEYTVVVKTASGNGSGVNGGLETFIYEKGESVGSTSGAAIQAIPNAPILKDIQGVKVWSEPDGDTGYRTDGVKLTLLRQECGANDKYGSWEPVKEAPVLTVDEKNNWESTFGIITSFRTHDLNQKPYKYTVTESAVGARGSLENYNCKVTQEVSGEAIRLIATNTLKAKHALTITKERKGSQATTQAAIYQFKLFFDKGFKVSEQEIAKHAANGLTLSAINGAKTTYQFSLTVPENATSASISVNVMEGIRFDLIEDTAGLDDCFVQYFLDSSWQDQKPGTGIVGAVMGTQDRQALVQNNYYGNDGIVIAKQATGKDGGVVPVDGKYTFLIKFWTAKSEEQTNTEWMKDVKANLEAKNAVVSGLLSGSSVSLAALQTAVASKGAAQAETNVAQAQYAAAKAALEKQLTVETASGSGVITTDQAMKAIAEAVAATEKESAELESQLLSKQEQLSGLAGNVSGAAIGEGTAVDTDAEKIAQLEKEIAALQQKLQDLQEKKAELLGQMKAIEQALNACDAAAATLTAKEAALEAAKQSVAALQGNMSEDAWNALLGATEEQIAAQNAYEMRQAGKNDAEDGILAQIRKAIVGFINFIQGISSSREDITGKVVPLAKGEDGYVFELKSSEEIAYKLQEYMKDHPGETIYYSVEETQNGGANATSIKDAAGNIQEGKIWRGEVTNLDEMVKTRITFTNTFDQKPVDPSPDPVEPAPNPDSGHRPRPDPIPEPIPEPIPPLVEIEEIKIPIGEAGEVMDPSQEKSKEVSIKEGNVPLGALPKTGGMGVLEFLAAGAILAGLGIHIKRKEDK